MREPSAAITRARCEIRKGTFIAKYGHLPLLEFNITLSLFLLGSCIHAANLKMSDSAILASQKAQIRRCWICYKSSADGFAISYCKNCQVTSYCVRTGQDFGLNVMI